MTAVSISFSARELVRATEGDGTVALAAEALRYLSPASQVDAIRNGLVHGELRSLYDDLHAEFGGE